MVIKRLDFTSFMKKICKNPKNPEKPLDSGGGGDIVKPASYDFEKTKQLHDESIKDLSLEGKCNIEGVECRPVFEVLKKHVKQYTPERASAITETAPDTIRRIAREYVDHARIGSTLQIDGVTLPHPHMDHLTYLNMVNPPPNFPVPLRQAVIKAKIYKAGGQDGLDMVLSQMYPICADDSQCKENTCFFSILDML